MKLEMCPWMPPIFHFLHKIKKIFWQMNRHAYLRIPVGYFLCYFLSKKYSTRHWKNSTILKEWKEFTVILSTQQVTSHCPDRKWEYFSYFWFVLFLNAAVISIICFLFFISSNVKRYPEFHIHFKIPHVLHQKKMIMAVLSRKVSTGHRCPHFSTFQNFRWTDRRTRANLNAPKMWSGQSISEIQQVQY